MTGAPVKRLHAAHHGRGAVHVDVGAHAAQLRHVHEAVLEDRLGDHRGAAGRGHQRHHLRLQVGREAGIRLGHHVDARAARRWRAWTRRPRFRSAVIATPARVRLSATALDHGRAGAHQFDIAAGDRRRHGVGAGLDPVGDDRMCVGAVQPLDALDR